MKYSFKRCISEVPKEFVTSLGQNTRKWDFYRIVYRPKTGVIILKWDMGKV
jgi:hypothetical protein